MISRLLSTRNLLVIMLVAAVMPAIAFASGGEDSILVRIANTVLQLGVIILVAKLAAEFFERFLKAPGVLGELVAGIVIGPFALGGMTGIFPIPHEGASVPVSEVLYTIAQLGAVVLLFMTGLETNLRKFIRYGVKATIIGIGGVIFPFFLGAFCTVAFDFAQSWTDPSALFVGAIMTATSVGITARVLNEMKKLDTPEGVSILAAAVVDDVLGILVLAVVVNIFHASRSGDPLTAGPILMIAIKAVGFWLGLTVLGIAFSKQIEKFLNAFRGEGTTLVVSLCLCFFAAGIAEQFGLAMIIGAYAMGLALSERDISHKLLEGIEPINELLMPIFFVVMGMLVDIKAMAAAFVFGLALTFLAIISKLFGCGLPALALGFNMRGAKRIGWGMLPRGEVALIVAGVGIAEGVISSEIFGVAIMMTLVTTLVAPLFLIREFKTDESGLKSETQRDIKLSTDIAS